MGRTAYCAFCFGVLFQAAVLPFAVHQHKAGSVPEFVAKVAIAFAALAVKVDAATQRRERGKSETQGVGAISGDSFGEFFLGVLFDLRCGFGFAQSLRAFLKQRLQGDAINQIDGV